MAQRKFYPKQQRPSDDSGGIYDDQPLRPSSGRTPYDLDKTDKFLSSIDDVLAENGSPEPEDAGDKSLSPQELRRAEEQADSGSDDSGGGSDKAESDEKEKLGKGYTGDAGKDSEEPQSVRAKLKNKRKAFFVGGGIGAGVVGVLVAVFLAFAPLKILHIVDNLQDRFFSSSESAVQRRGEALMNKYLKKYVIPGLGSRSDCNASTRTISRNCIAAIPGNSKADRLFRAWRDARFENKLADNFGLEIRKEPGNRYFLDVGSNSPLDITDMGLDDPNRNLFNDVGGNRNELRRAMSQAFEGESRWKKAMYRWKWGRLAERKYGLRRCIFACKAVDRFDDWEENKRNAAKLIILRRVVEPNTEMVGLALSCIIDGSCIDANEEPDPSSDGTGRKDTLEKQLRDYLDKRGIEYADDTIEKFVELVPKLTDIMERGLLTHFMDEVLTKVFNEQVAKVASKYAPIVGWVDTASRLINTVAAAGDKIKRYSFVIKSTAAVSLYMSYRTYADEIKTGNVDSELAGSMIEQLSDEAGDSGRYGQPAENSPLYAALFDDTEVATTPIPNILSATAFAQGATAPQAAYTCDNDEQIGVGEYVCEEEKMKAIEALTFFSDQFKNPPLSYLADMASYWLASGGAILDAIGGFIGGIFGEAVDTAMSVVPGISFIKQNLESLLGSLLNTLGEYLFPIPISPGMSGARTFSQMAAGADAGGNAFAQYGLGGVQLTPGQLAAIVEEQESQDRENFADESLFARMFDTNNDRSLVSRMAISMPTSYVSSAQGGIAHLITNPFSKLASGFGSLFTSPRTKAALTEDPFGIPQFGHPLDTTNFDYDPDIYTDEYCQQVNADWEAGTGEFEGTILIDPETGTDIHTKPNYCLLEASVTGSAGGFFESGLLTPEEVSGP